MIYPNDKLGHRGKNENKLAYHNGKSNSRFKL